MIQRAPRGVGVFVGAFIACTTVVIAFDSVAARAHESWISSSRLTDPSSGEWCCNHIDCREEKVREIAGGYQVETGEFIPYFEGSCILFVPFGLASTAAVLS